MTTLDLTLKEVNEDLVSQRAEGSLDYFYRDEIELIMSNPKEVQYFRDKAFALDPYTFQMIANACFRVKSEEIHEAFVYLLPKATVPFFRFACGAALAHLGDQSGYQILGELIESPPSPDDGHFWLALADTLILLHTPQALEMIKHQRLDFRVPLDIRKRAQQTIDDWDILRPLDYY